MKSISRNNDTSFFNKNYISQLFLQHKQSKVGLIHFMLKQPWHDLVKDMSTEETIELIFIQVNHHFP